MQHRRWGTDIRFTELLLLLLSTTRPRMIVGLVCSSFPARTTSSSSIASKTARASVRDHPSRTSWCREEGFLETAIQLEHTSVPQSRQHSSDGEERREALVGADVTARRAASCSSSWASQNQNRRSFLVASVVSTAAITVLFYSSQTNAASAAETATASFQQSAESLSLPVGLLESRVESNVLAPPPYGMERNDIFYPAWFRGTWKVASTTASVEAPCGVAIGFGSNSTYEAAQAEVGTSLQYDCRFVAAAPDADYCTADREFNVRRIAQAAFGPSSVLEIPFATPNKLTAILAPPGSPRTLQVDLFTVNRRQETVSPTRFDCSEVVREIVSAAGGGGSASQQQQQQPVLKEVETTSLYTYHASNNTITCRQRSASFLLPSQTNPLQYRKWELAQGRPVDVRYYNVVYTPRTK